MVLILSLILAGGLIAIIIGLALGSSMKMADSFGKYIVSILLIYGGGVAVNVGFWGLLIYFALKLIETYN